jgi:glycosidase
LALLLPTGGWGAGIAAARPAQPLPAPPTHVPKPNSPTSVTIAGSLQSEAGCAGDWDPACATTHLTYDAGDDVWQNTWTLPTGNYEYKATLNDNWDVNYGLHATLNGPNIPLNLAANGPVKFYYDDKSHWVTDNKSSVIATVPGSFQSELGCPGDWAPDCLRSWLQDIDGDGIYRFETTSIPAGDYECKVAINEAWDENYGVGGTPGGANYSFHVDTLGQPVKFAYDAVTHILTITAGHAHDNNVEYAGLGHNSQDPMYRAPRGAVVPNTPIKLRYRTFHNDVTGVQARVYDTASSSQTILNMQLAATGVSCYDAALSADTCDYWETTVTPTTLTTIYYRFIITDGTSTAYYADDNFKDGGWGVPGATMIDNSYPITVFDPAFQPITWMKDAVIYQIVPDRFFNGRASNDPTGLEPRYNYPPDPLDEVITKTWTSLPEGYCSHYVNPGTPCTEGPRGRDYFGGDLRGVDQKLDYLQSVGVTAIYFNPIFDAGSDHAYDTQNYYKIDPFFGTENDWKQLVTDANAHGIRIILDGVFNHVSSDSAYFDRYHHYSAVGACEDVNSPYRSWFTFHDLAGGPCAGPGGPNTMTYDGWFGFDSIPVLNKNVQAVRDLVYAQPNSVAPYWLRNGAAAWRLDVMGDGSFPADYWQGFRQAVKAANPNAPIIGELWKRDEMLPKIHGDQADTGMNYRFRNAILGFLGKVDNKGFPDDGATDEPPSLFARKLDSIREDYPDATYYTLMNLMDSHDTARILWTLTPGQENREEKEFNAANLALGKKRLRLATIIQFTIPGAPTVYYGDEVGVTGADDPDDRRTFPWNGANPGGDPVILAGYQQLAAIRAANPVLRDGTLKFLLTDDANRTMAYAMRTGTNAAVVAINRSETTTQTLAIPLGSTIRDGVTFNDALGGAGLRKGGPQGNVNSLISANGVLTVTLAPLTGAVYLPANGQDLTPPAAPTGLTATEGNAQVALSWTAPAGATSYRIYRSPVGGGGYSLIGTSSTPNYTDTPLTNSVRYYYVVTALDSLGNESAWSNEVAAVPYPPIGWAGHLWPPTMKFVISATLQQQAYAQVWVSGLTDPPGQAPGINAEFGYGPQGSDPATWTWTPMVFNAQAGNNDEYTIHFTPEVPGTYDYLARFSTNLGRNWTYAYTDSSARGVMYIGRASDDVAPPPPTNVHILYTAITSIAVAWDASPAADLYRYEVWRGPLGGPYVKIANVPAGTTQYVDTGLQTGATYTYVVTAQDTVFNRSWYSAPATGTAQQRQVAVTFNVTVPANTPMSDTVHIAGSFPSPYPTWDPGGLPMTRDDATHAHITLTLAEGYALEYKYTRGSWATVEKDASCQEIANRTLTIAYGPGGTQTVTDTVANWVDLCP